MKNFLHTYRIDLLATLAVVGVLGILVMQSILIADNRNLTERQTVILCQLILDSDQEFANGVDMDKQAEVREICKDRADF